MTAAPTVILVRPTEEGNVGAVARAMANFALERLILVEPATEIGARGRARAVGAGHVLGTLTRIATYESAIEPFRHVVGTSSQRQRIERVACVDAGRLARHAAGWDLAATALVFGPERSGLTTDELARCDTLVRIPTSSRQPTLNLAQAVLILAYELYPDPPGETSGPDAAPAEAAQVGDDTAADATAGTNPPATAGVVAGLLEHTDALLTRTGFARDATYDGVLRDLRRLAARARLTAREVQILRGICRRLENALDRADPAPRSTGAGTAPRSS